MTIVTSPQTTVESIINSLEAGTAGAKLENNQVMGPAYRTLHSWVMRRYTKVDLNALENGGLKADTRSQIAAQFIEQKAHEDIELLNRVMNLQQQFIHAPQEIKETIGVNLKDVEAENITIKDVYVGLPKPAEAPGFHCVMAYLERVSEMRSIRTTRFDSDRNSHKKRMLADIPVHLKMFGSDFAHRTRIYDAVQNSFRQDRKIKRIERVILLGNVGGGKTDALVQLRREAAKNSLKMRFSFDSEGNMTVDKQSTANSASKKNAGFVIPIYINLAELYNGNTISTLIRDEFNRHIDIAATQLEITAEQVPKLLKSYTCLLLFDSLDSQVTERARLEEIRSFMESNSEEQYVITCRRGTYRGQLGSLDELVVADLTKDETQEILGTYRYDMLSQSLKQLAHNRLMLRILLDLEQYNKRTANSLENKGQLVQLLCEERLRRALEEDPENILDEGLAESLLEHIAYHMYRNHLHRFSERQLMNVVKVYIDEWHAPFNWRQIVQGLARIGMLIPSGKRNWQFRDRITAPYYVAAALVNEPERLPPVLEEISNLWWRDVFELYVGIAHEPTKLFFDMMDRDILTAAHVAQYRDLSGSVYDAIVDTLIERMSQESALERRRIASYLGESGHERAAQALILAIHREKASNVVLAIAQAILLWTNQKEFENILAAEKSVIESSTTQMESFADLMKIFQHLAATSGDERAPFIDLLMQRFVDTKQSKLCRGLCAIGLGYQPSDETAQALFEIAMSDNEDPFVAWCAVDSLTQSTLLFLEQKAFDVFNKKIEQSVETAVSSLKEQDTIISNAASLGENEYRVRATYLLGWVCSGTCTLSLLRDKALNDENPAIRGYAVDSLLHLDLPDARECIEKRLASEEDPTVIRKCAEALTKIGAVSSLPELEHHLYNEYSRTRWALRKAVSEIRQRNGIE